MISVDNATSNDVAIRVLKQNFTITRQLSCGGKMFHVRCCAHILNLMVQDGLWQIRRIINKIHESVVYINGSEGRLKVFVEIVQQLRLPCQKLILDCKTRWNSTYDMLETAIKFKEVFPRYKERDEGYEHCPEKKIGYKMRVIEFSFPKTYSDVEARANATSVWDALYEVYGEYANDCQSSSAVHRGTSERVGLGVITKGFTRGGVDNWEFDDFLDEVETIEPNKSQLDIYLSEACYKCQGDLENFDALDWWKANALKYPILSRMARDILVIPITTVALEATFNVGSRVIDTYRSSLSPEIVEILLCGADWCRILNRVKKGITVHF
ncbi:zinc finger BED domain-containing protein RICESLEEPER 1-like [Pistacia vera]|uniref:zinc finger BED domain-containing protein RICESLEEPER 1-like n=1 Tax=Pistacia vera TaxID=55513 RepID=UPI001262F0DB|nr:zinc finger BED domain-containing protein RICESLEEPER 1-like [Pistacia vera]